MEFAPTEWIFLIISCIINNNSTLRKSDWFTDLLHHEVDFKDRGIMKRRRNLDLTGLEPCNTSSQV